MNLSKKGNSGFTLIELLVVIAILAVLAVAVTLILNPAELIRQGRDSIRLSDLATINKALGLYQTDQIAKWMGTSTIVYTSLPDTDSSCSSYGLPSLPDGWSYNCETTTTYTNVNGTGWLPVDFTNMSFSSPLARLPVDPVNQATTSKYYTYVTGGSWELSAVMEAVSNKLGGDNDRVSEDGGDSYSYYEVGSDVNLNPINDDGLVGYWQFDEGTGTSANDSSGHNNNGTITGASWSTSCIYGNCLSFDGDGDYVQVDGTGFDFGSNSFSIVLWSKIASGVPFVIYSNSGGQYLHIYVYYIQAQDDDTNTLTQRQLTGFLDGNWHFVTIIIDQTNKTLHYGLDGSLADYNLSLDNITTFTFNKFRLGVDKNGNYDFNGTLDDIRIYNRALSAAEVEAIYNSY